MLLNYSAAWRQYWIIIIVIPLLIYLSNLTLNLIVVLNPRCVCNLWMICVLPVNPVLALQILFHWITHTLLLTLPLIIVILYFRIDRKCAGAHLVPVKVPSPHYDLSYHWTGVMALAMAEFHHLTSFWIKLGIAIRSSSCFCSPPIPFQSLSTISSWHFTLFQHHIIVEYVNLSGI